VERCSFFARCSSLGWPAAVALVLGVALALASTAVAQSGQRFDVRVTVSQISDQEGPVDSRAKRLDATIRKQFKYASLTVIEERKLDLELDEVGSVELPSGEMFRVRPLNLGERGLLMSVGWEGAMQMDMRAHSGHLVVIGGPPYKGGQLVISIEPAY
jgi:hypothetical protein